MPTSRKNGLPPALLAAIGLAPLAILHLVRPPEGGLWMQTFANSLHVPVFAAVTLAVYVLTRRRYAGAYGKRLLATAGIACLAGAVSEILQIPGARDASLQDLFADWMSTAAVILAAICVSGSFSGRYVLRAICGTAAITIFVIALMPLLTVSAAYLERNSNVPAVFLPDAEFARMFVRTQDSVVDDMPTGNRLRPSVRVILGNGPYPGIILHDIWPNWAKYSKLVIEMENFEETSLTVNLRVHDREHARGAQLFTDRFNTSVTLHKGLNSLEIPLRQVADGPQHRRMDMTRIEGLALFGMPSDAGRSFDLLSIRLQ